jgi:cytochrome c551
MKAKAAAFIFLTSLLVLQCGRDSKFEQYFVRGEQLYIRNCSNCHQKNGEGLGLLYPPVQNSDFIEANFETTLCLMKHGIQGELIVNGKSFNQPMKGVYSLTDLEIAEIATYLYNSGNLKRGLIPVAEVAKVMQSCDQ